MEFFNSVYSGGFSSYLSANTLRNSPRNWSFPKADRFLQFPPDNNAKYINFPSTHSTRYSTFGFGERDLQRNLPGFDTPAPSWYKIPSPFDGKRIELNKGKSFGISRGYYENVYVPKQTSVSPRVSVQVPGPDFYNPLAFNPIGKNAKKFTIKSRIPICSSATKNFPAPNMYKPVHTLTEANRYSGIGFGLGNRGNPSGTSSNKIGRASCRERVYGLV